MQRNSAKVNANGRPATWLGANFWSRAGGPLMWRSYDPELIRTELAVLADHGLTMTRSFFYWPDFMPGPYEIDEKMTSRFADFLDRHTEQGLTTVPTFIVGHMSGENWDPAWRGGRDLYSDVWMVGRQAWFAAEMTRRYAGHPAVAGWLVSNEMPIYGGATSHEIVAAWAQIIRDAVRAAGGHQPFSLGDGAWGIEVTGRDNGFRLTEIAELTDFLGPHTYPVGDDPVRQRYAAAVACALSGTFGKPVIMEEFGVSGDFASEANAAVYYRHVLWNTLLAGATGWIAWNNTDFDLPAQEPYRHHAFELNFGITDAGGSPKQTLHEMQAFGRVLDQLEFSRCRRPDTDTALIVPSYLDTRYPFTAPEAAEAVARALSQGYVSACLADLAPGLTRETTGIAGDAKLYLAPSVKQILAPTANLLENLATRGACVYVSYSSGDVRWHRGPSYGRMNDLFGIQHQLDVGLADPIEDAEVQLTFTRDFGGLTRGTTLTFPAGGGEHSRTFLPAVPVTAEVIATDARGRPALLGRPAGEGTLILCVYPLEYMAAMTPRANQEPLVALYAALAEHAGVRRPVTVDDPRVACDVLARDDGARFAVLVSQAAEPVTVKPVVDGGTSGSTLTALDGSKATGGVSLDPFGVAVVEIAPPDTGQSPPGATQDRARRT
ncbi:MAG TPA: cellulase family glycosylhydrolase [Trebonia sp.]